METGAELEDDSSSESDAEPEEKVLEDFTAAVRAEARPGVALLLLLGVSE